MTRPLAAIVMAAGKGTRMKSDTPKVLHAIAGEPLLGHVLYTLSRLGPARQFVIVGHGAEQVEAMLPADVTPVLQAEQLGTGHAVDQVTPFLNDFDGTVLILSGDVPLLSARTLETLLARHREEKATLTLLTAVLEDPTGYGRVVRKGAHVARIVEHKDADEDERRLNEVNMGTYVCEWAPLRAALAALTPNNAQGEYYLTDAIARLVSEGHPVSSYITTDPTECLGINTRGELAKLTAEYNRRTAAHWMVEGVTIHNPDTTVIGPRVQIGRDTILEPGTILLGETIVGERCIIGAYSQLRDATLGSEVEVLNSYLVDSSVGDRTHVGPYAHLRGHARLGDDVRLGNFVEVKNSTLGDGSKAAHLAYLGDATVGKKVNIGCGVITVNYDGEKKSPTIIEDGAFVGSNASLIAPLTVHAGGFVAAGSTITEDVPADSLAIGRARQVNKPEWVLKRRGARKQ
ncbi:MAG TPA: bifunctional UDP-N-acetylglucosamine diphosphorylase/glucosamine-1-phosphate N-acetyltransferase GlmU [Oscillatoriaceae cyanobacterium]